MLFFKYLKITERIFSNQNKEMFSWLFLGNYISPIVTHTYSIFGMRYDGSN